MICTFKIACRVKYEKFGKYGGFNHEGLMETSLNVELTKIDNRKSGLFSQTLEFTSSVQHS